MITIVKNHTPECTKLHNKNLQGACSRTPLAAARNGMYFKTSYSLKLYHPCVNMDLGLWCIYVLKLIKFIIIKLLLSFLGYNDMKTWTQHMGGGGRTPILATLFRGHPW